MNYLKALVSQFDPGNVDLLRFCHGWVKEEEVQDVNDESDEDSSSYRGW